MVEKTIFVLTSALSGRSVSEYLRSIGEAGPNDALVIRPDRSEDGKRGVRVTVRVRTADPPKESVFQSARHIRVGTPSREMNRWWDLSASKRKKREQGHRKTGYLGQRSIK